jgi:DNA-binding MarR family transcriptional regulator
MPDQNPTSDTARFFAFFNEVGILYQLASAMFEARLPAGILVSQFAVLNHLVRVADGRTPLDLARAFQVPKTTMTHTLAVLEKHQLIQLAANPKDGRSKCVWITDQGRDFRIKAIESLAPDFAALSAKFPTKQLETALPTLQSLREIMDKQRDT